MVRLPSSLADAGCRKPNCRTGSDTLHRHHKRHQAMWLAVWAGRREPGNRYDDFINNYWMFRSEDVVLVCDHHHAEVHILYDKIIQLHRFQTQTPLYKYTWEQAMDLMSRLEAACLKWLGKESPGVPPDQRFAQHGDETRKRKGRKKRKKKRKPST